MGEYIRCPRCELNFIKKKDKLCSVCQAEINAGGDNFDELDMETCPICKTNYIRPDEIMCAQCAKERSMNGENIGLDDDWESYIDNEEENETSIEEETGDMASVTDLEDDDLDDLDSDMPEIDEEFDLDDEPEEEEEQEESVDDDDDFIDDDDFDDDDSDDDDDDF
ncbi:MAG: hypothetical protein MR423_02170 [Firmicutes bacterium]|nr:hypothetical protein [Bacillota bacterium]MDY3659264.1 hypothetical protein [Eubacteriales bacterium]